MGGKRSFTHKRNLDANQLDLRIEVASHADGSRVKITSTLQRHPVKRAYNSVQIPEF